MSRISGDTGKDVSQPGLRIDIVHLGRDDLAAYGRSASPPRSDPPKSQSSHPRATLLSPDSVALLERDTRPQPEDIDALLPVLLDDYPTSHRIDSVSSNR
jgi:hypothetical protein